MNSAPYILVVDDDENTREVLRGALEAAGYEVKTASDGRDALDILTNDPVRPRLVLLDVQMPVMDGYEFLAAVRGRSDLAAIPVVVVTATNYDRRLTGSVGYIKKPLRLDQIVSAVRTWCGAPGSPTSAG